MAKLPAAMRLLLAVTSHFINSHAGPALTQRFLDSLQQLFGDLGVGNLENALNATDVSRLISQAFEEADGCFRSSVPPALGQIVSNGALPLPGLQSLEGQVQALSDRIDTEDLSRLIRGEFAVNWGTVLTPDQIEQCTAVYIKCLNRALGRQFPSPKSLSDRMFDLHEISLATYSINQKTFEAIAELRQLLNTLSTRHPLRRNRLKALPARTYDKLVGRDREVEEVYNLILNGRNRFIVLHGPNGVGKTSIAREAAERLNGATIQDQGQAVPSEIFLIWHSIPAHSHHAKQAFDELKYQISTALDIKSRKRSDHWRELQEGFTLLILDGLREEIAPLIVDYLVNGLPPNVHYLITCPQQLPWARYHCDPYEIKVEGLPAAYIPELFRLAGQTKDLTDEERKQIADRTSGNVMLLKTCADELHTASLQEVLTSVVYEARNVVERLKSKAAVPLLKICALFDNFAHQDALTAIIEPSLQEEVPQALKELNKSFILRKDPEAPRYQIEDLFRQFMIQRMKDGKEYDDVRERWAKYYVELRPREESYNDETGWTIFTDYQPETHGSLSYADEAFTILSVIHYCLSAERAQTHWTRAAKLLDDFRATIFASGRWEDRLTFCEQVIEHARMDRQLPTLGKFYRLLAWILCFRDEYEAGRARAKNAIQVASEGLRMEGLSEQDRYTHLQTLYKAHNTLGQIALREARTLARAGHQAPASSNASPPASDPRDLTGRLANPDSIAAAMLFRGAEIKFSKAMQVVEEFFLPEALVMEYHMAEVGYYDRYAISTDQPEEKRIYTREQLFRVRLMFLEVLKKAHEPCDGFKARRPHQRLIANTKYYLGKTLRRLGALSLEGDSVEPNWYFSEAEGYLNEALRLANQFNDRVLAAKIKYAQCQWCESQAGRPRNALVAADYFSRAQQLALEAIDEFTETRMRLEGDDAQAFYERRLLRNW